VSDLVVIAFPTQAVRKKLLNMQQEYLIELGDAVIAVKQPNGGVKGVGGTVLRSSFDHTKEDALRQAFGSRHSQSRRVVPRCAKMM
jgi:uncharacterized membrane protein